METKHYLVTYTIHKDGFVMVYAVSSKYILNTPNITGTIEETGTIEIENKVKQRVSKRFGSCTIELVKQANKRQLELAINAGARFLQV